MSVYKKKRIKCEHADCTHWLNPNAKHYANDPDKLDAKKYCKWCKLKDKKAKRYHVKI
jgi:ribosomal protein L33